MCNFTINLFNTLCYLMVLLFNLFCLNTLIIDLIIKDIDCLVLYCFTIIKCLLSFLVYYALYFTKVFLFPSISLTSESIYLTDTLFTWVGKRARIDVLYVCDSWKHSLTYFLCITFNMVCRHNIVTISINF